MKIPLSPPPLEELFVAAPAEMLPQLALLDVGPLVQGDYLHWDDLRHRAPPEGLNTDKPFNRTSRSIDLSNRLQTPSEPWISRPCGRFTMKKHRRQSQ
jgi:hypothetical protein